MNVLAGFLEHTLQTVDPLVLPFALLCGLALATGAFSLMITSRSRAFLKSVVRQTRTDSEQSAAGLDALRQEFERQAALILELQRQPAVVSVSSKGTINLNKRSQVLRLHRRGDQPAQIASALGVPLQEVDLTLKVHNIVMKNI